MLFVLTLVKSLVKTFETTLKQSSPDNLIIARADLAGGVASATIVSNISL